METQGRSVESEAESHADGDVGLNGRRYRSPNRVLARSMRISRDNWKTRHQAVQEKLEQERQLAADRGRFITAIVATHLRNISERSGSARSSSVRQRSALVAAADGSVRIARPA